MPEGFLKITYHYAPAGSAKKLNIFVPMPSDQFDHLYSEIERYLFEKRDLPVCNFRIYWIDSDSDEIDLSNQRDYVIFLAKCEKNMHLHIAIDDDLSNFITHKGIECDSCKACPLIGFRYRCMQCPNFDLCQACESAHKHPKHFMVRIPANQHRA
ncbi:protein ref(2)P [Drosophila virilis]|uniref:ZZ-type domain-containing protein n=1 Tax=Drosophila virilis TaxID=7244 RepID=A0A0Q9W9M0_DROVI|nr:protein ref(2)P [Drosophila virilis]KRF77892.1 uncharacterized protein Dvir_GJ27101 [Drosophila virilis]